MKTADEMLEDLNIASKRYGDLCNELVRRIVFQKNKENTRLEAAVEHAHKIFGACLEAWWAQMKREGRSLNERHEDK